MSPLFPYITRIIYADMKLIVVSNRLPVSITRTKNGFDYTHSSGGLVTGLQSINKKIEFIWFGNLSSKGLSIEDKDIIRNDCATKFNLHPIFIDPQLNNDSYNGFCNGILWPMLHYFSDDVVVTENYLQSYIEYNETFCDEIIKEVDTNDIIWVHDYHLMVLPKMLRDKLQERVKIMFFLHTPFPSSLSFNKLFCRTDILQGIVASDVVSFHCYDYLSNFLECCKSNAVTCNSIVDAIPIGIDPELFVTSIKTEETQERIRYFRKKFEGKKIILGVDRSDYIKGIPHRIQGYTEFINKYPEYKTNTVFLQIGVPSRTEVTEYKGYRECIDKLVSETNSTTGSIDHSNIYLLNQSVDFSTLCALYYISDILLISSLRDGMNLVAMEFISCNYDTKGVLILSEFTGVSTTLPGCVGVNPWNTKSICDKIKMSLEMDEDERHRRFEINSTNVYKFTSFKWAEDNLNALGIDWKSDIKK